MASPNDNFQLKDATDNTFRARAKDVSSAQDGSLQFMRHLNTPYPVDYGIGGCFQIVTQSGTMAAGLAAGSPIWGLRFTSGTMLAIIRRLELSMWNTATGFTAGVATFSLSVARGWTTDDTGGTALTLTGNNGKARTSMATAIATIRTASTATLAAGTRSLDANPVGLLPAAIGTATQAVFLQRSDLLRKGSEHHPITLAQNEGIVLAASVPATGTWSFAIEAEWDEVTLSNY